MNALRLCCILPRCSAHVFLAAGIMAVVAAPGFLPALSLQQSIYASSASTLFSDDFETGDLNKWDSSLGWEAINASSDSDGKKARSAGGQMQSPRLEKQVSTVDYQNIRLSYSYRISGFDEGDVAQVQYYSQLDGGWQVLENYTANTDGWMAVSTSLPSTIENRDDFKVRFFSDANGSNDLFYVDSVMITGEYIGSEDIVGPVISQTSHQADGVWSGDIESGAAWWAEVTDPSGISKVEFSFQSPLDQDFRFPVDGALQAMMVEENIYQLELDASQLAEMVDILALAAGDELFWQINTTDVLENTSQQSLRLKYQPQGDATVTEVEVDVDDGAVTGDDSSSNNDGDNNTDSNDGASRSDSPLTSDLHDVQLANTSNQVLASTSDNEAESAKLASSLTLPNTGGASVHMLGLSVAGLGLTALLAYRYGGRWFNRQKTALA